MNWPEHLLPLPSESYTASVDPKLAKTEFEVGFRQRRKFSGIEERIGVQWVVNQLELDIMEAFIQRNLQHGSMPVEMSVISLDGVRRETVRILNGAISKDYLPGSYYRVSATLIAEPRAIASEDTMEWLLYLEDGTAEGIVEAYDILHLFIESFYMSSIESSEVKTFLLLHS